jgi:hypothetical protein
MHQSSWKQASAPCTPKGFLIEARLETERFDDLPRISVTILIVLRPFGFFIFHVTAGFIDNAFVLGIALLVFHLLTGKTSTA